MHAFLRHMLTLAALCVPELAAAEGSILTRPADCKAVMTIQKHGCEVETHLVCGTGDTRIRREESYDIAGLQSVTLSDHHYSLIEFQDASGEYGVIADPAKSFSDLPENVIAKGTGNLAQIGIVSMLGIKKPVTLTGKMTSETEGVVISGRNLHRFSVVLAMQLPAPMPLLHGVGKSYFDTPTGVLFDGELEMDWPPSDSEIPNTPAAIFLPGQPGFNETYPTYDCGDISLNHMDEKADRL